MGFNATGNYIYSQKTDGWFLFHKFSPSDRVRELLQTNNSGDTECIHNKKCPGISNSINEQYLQETKENKSQRFYILSFFIASQHWYFNHVFMPPSVSLQCVCYHIIIYYTSIFPTPRLRSRIIWYTDTRFLLTASHSMPAWSFVLFLFVWNSILYWPWQSWVFKTTTICFVPTALYQFWLSVFKMFHQVVYLTLVFLDASYLQCFHVIMSYLKLHFVHYRLSLL